MSASASAMMSKLFSRKSRSNRVAPGASSPPDTASASSSPDLGSASASASDDTDDMTFEKLPKTERLLRRRIIRRQITHLNNEKAKAKKEKDFTRAEKLSTDIEQQQRDASAMDAQHYILSKQETDTRRVKNKLELQKASAKVGPSGGRRTRRHKKSRTRRRHKKSRKY
jgi:hypothetical protein